MTSFNDSQTTAGISYGHLLIETPYSRLIKFIILFSLQLTSICCSLFLLFHLFSKPALYRALHNHTTIALVLISLFQAVSDLPMVLIYLQLGQAPTPRFCLLWNFLALSNYAAGIWTMTWTSLERHLFIFHAHLLITDRGRLLFHYLPLIAAMAIPWTYYVIMVFVYPCVNRFQQEMLFCGWCCYVANDRLVFFNWLAFAVIPTSSITLLSVSLISRVIMRTHRAQKRVNWYKHRHLIIQLLALSALYLVCDAPVALIGLIQLFVPAFALELQMLYLVYIVYLLPLLVPFICLGTCCPWSDNERVLVHQPVPLRRPRTYRLQYKNVHA